jgi:hypothetical protein
MPQLDLFIGIQQFAWVSIMLFIFFIFTRFYIVVRISMNAEIKHSYKKIVLNKLTSELLKQKQLKYFTWS